jgi:HK97 family phage major capsid protein
LITLQSEELARSSDPNSETLLRDGLSQSIALEKNKHFISAAAPVAGISPGGILNGLPGGQTFASSGNTPADVQADITHAISLLNEGLGATNPAWIMNTLTKTWLAGLQNGAQTGTQFPTVAGGTLAGYPIVDSTTQPAGTIILLDQALVILAEEDAIEIDISREASVQMDSAPADPAVGLVSLWQNNLIGLRGEQFTYWMRARDSAVVTITGVGYTTWPPAGLMRAPQAPQAPQGSHAPAEGARR